MEEQHVKETRDPSSRNRLAIQDEGQREIQTENIRGNILNQNNILENDFISPSTTEIPETQIRAIKHYYEKYTEALKNIDDDCCNLFWSLWSDPYAIVKKQLSLLEKKYNQAAKEAFLEQAIRESLQESHQRNSNIKQYFTIKNDNLSQNPNDHEIISQDIDDDDGLFEDNYGDGVILPIESLGLNNSGVDCYLNSALQTLRVIFQSLPYREQISILKKLEQQDYLYFSQNQLKKKQRHALDSPFAAFLQNQFDGRNLTSASFLRQEIRSIMLNTVNCGLDSSQYAQRIVNNIDPKTGCSKQQDDESEALIALLEYLEIPPVCFQEKDTYLETGRIRKIEHQEYQHSGGEPMIRFHVGEKPTSIQEILNSNLVTTISGVKDDDGSIHDILKEKILANTPDSLTILFSRLQAKPDSKGNWISGRLHTPISNVTGDIILPVVNNMSEDTFWVNYRPYAIVCHVAETSSNKPKPRTCSVFLTGSALRLYSHANTTSNVMFNDSQYGSSINSGHYITFVRQGDSWYLMNDTEVIPVDLENSSEVSTHYIFSNPKQFIEKNAYTISYRRVGDDHILSGT